MQMKLSESTGFQMKNSSWLLSLWIGLVFKSVWLGYCQYILGMVQPYMILTVLNDTETSQTILFSAIT